MKDKTPPLSATNSKEAQAFIHKYGISQFRVTEYLTAIPFLTAEGTMPTDVSIARHLSQNRTPQAVASTMNSLIKVGLVRIVGETAKGNHYALTEHGSKAVIEIKGIQERWMKSHETNVEPVLAPDYSNSFRRLNHTIKALEEANAALQQTVNYQMQIMANQQRELDSYRAGSGVALPNAMKHAPFNDPFAE